jgi:hypothetical protein
MYLIELSDSQDQIEAVRRWSGMRVTVCFSRGEDEIRDHLLKPSGKTILLGESDEGAGCGVGYRLGIAVVVASAARVVAAA